MKLVGFLSVIFLISGCMTHEKRVVYKTKYVDPETVVNENGEIEETDKRLIKERVVAETTVEKPFSRETRTYHFAKSNVKKSAVASNDLSNTKVLNQKEINLKPSKPLKPRKVKEIQAALNRKGYFVSIDGVLGTQTRTALTSFQQKNGLKAHGQVDSFTLDALGINMPVARL